MSSGQQSSDAPAHRYSAAFANAIEPQWQARWAEQQLYRVANPGEPGFDASRPKFYCLDMFPYPSGAGLHVGHPEGYTATDILCRYKRMQGCNVLHPMGWDAFGLPAEQYAIATGVHPAITTKKAIDNFRRQLQRFGFSYDWSREVGTIDPEYYAWTQWIFVELYNAWWDGAGGTARRISELEAEFASGARPVRCNPKADEIDPAERANVSGPWSTLDASTKRRVLDSYRLAYLAETTVNWCPKLGTVLANDEVIDGKSERGGYPVLRKPLRQWMFRITAYAERLLTQLDALDWPESTKTMQREWIGKSEGAEIDFKVLLETPKVEVEVEESLRVFTTRPDTIFGATYMVVAPEHELVQVALAAPDDVVEPAVKQALRDYTTHARNRSEVDRQEAKEKTGVFTGLFAKNPATSKPIPIWTADYVLMGYGTGAIMAVPAHDERDFEFAFKYDLSIAQVVTSNPDARDGRRGKTWKCVINPSMPRAEYAGLGAEFGSHGSTGSDAAVTEIRFMQQSGAKLFAERFGAKYNVTVRYEVDGCDMPRADDGVACNSANDSISLNGLPTPEAKQKVIAWLESCGLGTRKVNYKLRDWTFSRQRYWGEPFPIVYDDAGNHYPISAKALPVKLPELADYAPIESDDPQPLLAKAGAWVRTTAGQAGVDPALLAPSTPVTRETNTMPGSAGSSWYFLRYCDPRNLKALASRDALATWMGEKGVDFYLGGSEHAVGHLLYSRFWNNVLFDLGHIPNREPFQRLFHQGLITSFAYQRADKTLVPVDQVEERAEGNFVEIATGAKVTQIVAKMSKSLKNVVNPDDVIAEFGADTFRLYEMAMGPLDASKPWNPRDIAGCFRFLQRAWRMLIDEQTGTPRLAGEASPALERLLHRTIKKVGEDIEKLAFNTAIAAMIEFVNEATSDKPTLTRNQGERFLLLLAPFAPHLAEEAWHRLGRTTSIVRERWPSFDPAQLVASEVEVPISINGKVRTRILVPAASARDAKELEAFAMAQESVRAMLEGKPVKKVIAVPNKMVNVVV